MVATQEQEKEDAAVGGCIGRWRIERLCLAGCYAPLAQCRMDGKRSSAAYGGPLRVAIAARLGTEGDAGQAVARPPRAESAHAAGREASGGGADPCLLIVKNLPGKFMRARMKQLLAPLVSHLGDDLVRVKGPVASQVAFLELRDKAAVERTIARHRMSPFKVRFEEGAEDVELALDVDRPPAIRRMATLQWPLKRLLVDEGGVSDVLFVRKGRPGTGTVEVLARRDGHEALIVAATATFAEGSRGCPLSWPRHLRALRLGHRGKPGMSDFLRRPFPPRLSHRCEFVCRVVRPGWRRGRWNSFGVRFCRGQFPTPRSCSGWGRSGRYGPPYFWILFLGGARWCWLPGTRARSLAASGARPLGCLPSGRSSNDFWGSATLCAYRKSAGLPPTCSICRAPISTLVHLGSWAMSSSWGGVVVSISSRLSAKARDVRHETVIRGRILQVDVVFAAAVLRILSVHVDPRWSGDELRAAFEAILARSDQAGVVSFVAGDFNSIVGDEVRFRRGAPAAPAGDGATGELADAALSHLTELHQPCWTYRAFVEGRIAVASRLDRVYSSLPSAAFSLLAGPAAVRGDILRRDGPSDHLPVVVRLRRRVFRDPRLLPPVDRRVFEHPLYYEALRKRIAISDPSSASDAQEQLEALKEVARDVALYKDLWPFAAGVATARDKARLALRAQRLWYGGRLSEILRVAARWPDLSARLNPSRGIRDEASFVT